MVGISRVDPHGMMVAVNLLDDVRPECLAAVVGYIHGRAHHPDPLIVVGGDADLAVIHRPWVGRGHLFPGRTFVFGPKNSALLVLDDGIDDAGIPAIDVEAAP